MTTKPLTDPLPCEYERYDDKNKSYACGNPGAVLWVATEEFTVPVCKSCLNWLETLESLGQKP